MTDLLRVLFQTCGKLTRIRYIGCGFILLAGSLFIEAFSYLIADGFARLAFSFMLNIPIWISGFCTAVQRARDARLGTAFVVWMYALVLAGCFASIVALTENGGLIGDPMSYGAGLLFILAALAMNLILVFTPSRRETFHG